MFFVLLIALAAMVVIARNIIARLGRVSEQAKRLNAGIIDGPRNASVGATRLRCWAPR